MANFVYTSFINLLATGAVDLSGTPDLRALLVMTNTTADTDDDVANIADFGTLDECDGASYARQTFASVTDSLDTTNNRFEVTGDPITFADLGVGTRQNQAMVVYIHVTNDADAILVGYIDTITGDVTFPFDGDGTDVVLTAHADGLLQVKRG